MDVSIDPDFDIDFDGVAGMEIVCLEDIAREAHCVYVRFFTENGRSEHINRYSRVKLLTSST